MGPLTVMTFASTGMCLNTCIQLADGLSNGMMDASIAPARGRALRHDIADALRAEIISGRLEPGERVLEIDLARQFGVSRQPVREAIRTLEREGLLTSLPNRCTFVTRASLEDAIALQTIRA